MSFFNPELEIPRKEKKSSPHPWDKIIKHAFMSTYKYAHNSAKNPIYPPPKKGRVPSEHRMKFTMVGTRTSKEFIYCAKLLNGLHKYRWRHFDTPTISGVTSVDWPRVWNDLKIKYGGELYCLETPVAIFLNGEFLGGIKELKELIKSKYIYYIHPDYFVEAIDQFRAFMEGTNVCHSLQEISSLESTMSYIVISYRQKINPLQKPPQNSRPFAHLDIFIDGKYAGAMVFMLFSDIVPRTCDNFLKRCQEKKGGYSGTPVHRIVKDGWIQCGGFGLKETNLDCENFIAPPDRRGAIAMANDGRNVDCSTQFFVLLQPQDWMAFKYVFFGQLVIGEETLKKIEQVPTWYQSPKADIIISQASILNLKCHDIKINKGINKYIEGHTEDLMIIGEMFYEALLDKVFLEVQLRSLQRIQDEMIVCEGEGVSEEIITKNLQTTQRFMRKKEEIEKQIEKSSIKTTPAATVSARSEAATPAPADKGVNNDFDVEEYEYTPEEYSYQHVTAYHVSESVFKPESPYYIPLTDVPYPGEVSSEYDLKRLLQGDYCFQGDLDKDLGKPKKKQPEEENLIKHSEVLDELLASRSAALKTAADSEISLGLEDDDDEIKRYLEEFADTVSFTGKVVRKMAMSDRDAILDTHEKRTNIVPDEALRQYRVAEYELRRGLEKKVSITVPPPEPSEIRKEINRRQTGFVRPEDLTRMRQFERHDDSSSENDELDDYLPYTRQVSIQHPHSVTSYKKLMAQPSTRPDDKLTINSKISYYEPPERQKPKKEGIERLFASVSVMDGKDVRKKGKESQAVGVGWNLESSIHMPRFSDVSGRRMSVLGKLMDDVVTDQGPGPTLKDFQPFSEKQNKPLFFLTYSPEKNQILKHKSDTSREIYLRRRHSIASDDLQRKPLDQILFLQHGKKVYRKISTDYVKTINHIEKKEETSLRSLEYAKYRPAISIKAYQKKNKEYRESLTKQSTMSNDIKTEDDKEKKTEKKRSDRKLQ